MWEKVSSRAHAPLKIFPFGPDASEVMLYGTVKYGLKAGGESSKDWAARARLVKDANGKVMMSFYQVYLVRHSASACAGFGGFRLTSGSRIREHRPDRVLILGKYLDRFGGIDVNGNIRCTQPTEFGSIVS
jgi:hypothetical protein